MSEQVLETILTEIKSVTKKMDKRFNEVDHRFEQMDKRFNEVDHRFEQMDKRFNEVDHRFEQVDKRFNEVDERFGQVLESLDAKHIENINVDSLILKEVQILRESVVLLIGKLLIQN